MTAGDADDLRRQFDAPMSGAELSDLGQVASNMTQIAGGGFIKRTHNPHLRSSPR